MILFLPRLEAVALSGFRGVGAISVSTSQYEIPSSSQTGRLLAVRCTRRTVLNSSRSARCSMTTGRGEGVPVLISLELGKPLLIIVISRRDGETTVEVRDQKIKVTFGVANSKATHSRPISVAVGVNEALVIIRDILLLLTRLCPIPSSFSVIP